MYMGAGAVPLNQRARAVRQQVTVQPYRGVAHSVQYMKQFALEGQSHPDVRRYVIGVIRQVEPKDYLSEMAAIYYDVCRTVRYTRDPANREFIHHPAVVLQTRAGDCDDQAVVIKAAVAASNAAVGVPVEFVTVGFDRRAPIGQRYTHVFARAQDTKTGNWLVMDPVAGPHARDMVRRVQVFQSYPV